MVFEGIAALTRVTFRDWLSMGFFLLLVVGALWAALQLLATPHPDYPCSESATSMIPACPARMAR